MLSSVANNCLSLALIITNLRMTATTTTTTGLRMAAATPTDLGGATAIIPDLEAAIAASMDHGGAATAMRR